ncbi:MAG: prepilin peptidase [Myxococcaceae bacterium]|nr:prepilin peptidase [Myxococcaceae bacterium]
MLLIDPELLLLIVLPVLGLLLGSFFNVVIARVPRGESIVRPGSRCPKCGHALRWYENVPVLSWLALRGRCSRCKTPISPRYVAVELLTGALFFACGVRFGLTWQIVPAVLMVCFLVPLIFIDAAEWILPFELTLPGIAVGLLLPLYIGWEDVKVAAIGAASGFLTFRAVEYLGWKLFKKEAMGAGDKFLVALICAYLSVRALPGLFLLSSLQGSIFGLTAIALSGRAGPQTETEGEEVEREEAPPTMTWEFTKPGLPLWRRLVLLPWCILLQPIPDEPKNLEGEEIDWQPGPTNLPFGPWLGLAAIELMLVGPWLSQHVPYVGGVFML